MQQAVVERQRLAAAQQRRDSPASPPNSEKRGKPPTDLPVCPKLELRRAVRWREVHQRYKDVDGMRWELPIEQVLSVAVKPAARGARLCPRAPRQKDSPLAPSEQRVAKRSDEIHQEGILGRLLPKGLCEARVSALTAARERG